MYSGVNKREFIPHIPCVIRIFMTCQISRKCNLHVYLWCESPPPTHVLNLKDEPKGWKEGPAGKVLVTHLADLTWICGTCVIKGEQGLLKVVP